MESERAIDVIKRMYKGEPTEVQLEALELAYEALRSYKPDNGWIPSENPPKDSGYILLSFVNFSVPLVGRYEEDEEGGAYYVGDDADSCVSQDIIVNAWRSLPESYRG